MLQIGIIISDPPVFLLNGKRLSMVQRVSKNVSRVFFHWQFESAQLRSGLRANVSLLRTIVSLFFSFSVKVDCALRRRGASVTRRPLTEFLRSLVCFLKISRLVPILCTQRNSQLSESLTPGSSCSRSGPSSQAHLYFC
jgi:hypothetical protein